MVYTWSRTSSVFSVRRERPVCVTHPRHRRVPSRSSVGKSRSTPLKARRREAPASGRADQRAYRFRRHSADFARGNADRVIATNTTQVLALRAGIGQCVGQSGQPPRRLHDRNAELGDVQHPGYRADSRQLTAALSVGR